MNESERKKLSKELISGLKEDEKRRKVDDMKTSHSDLQELRGVQEFRSLRRSKNRFLQRNGRFQTQHKNGKGTI